MKEKPIVVIGGGSIGRRHIKNLKTLGFQNIYCLKRSKDIAFEKEFNVKVITSYEQLKALKPFVVFVCNPTSLHVESLEQIVNDNAHIFMEKPLIHNTEGLALAKEILKNFKKVFFIGFMLRFHPLVNKIKSVIDSKQLGKVYSARLAFGSYLPYWHPYEDYKISYASKKELGGGVINTITHELDLIQHIFGDPKSVIGKKSNFNKLKIDVEEVFEGVLVYDDKLVSLHLDYLQKDYDRTISILCDEGRIDWNWHENEILIRQHKKKTVKHGMDDFDVNQLYLDEVRHFFKLIEHKVVNHGLNAAHAFKNTEITLALHRTSEERKEIRLA